VANVYFLFSKHVTTHRTKTSQVEMSGIQKNRSYKISVSET